MVQVITLSNPRLAQAFVDYMVTKQVQLVIREQAQSVVLWLVDETQLVQVEQELKRFLQEPDHPRYQAASWKTGSIHSGLRYADSGYWHSIRRQAEPLTISIVLLSVLVYVVQIISGNVAVMRYLAWPESYVQHFQLWRYFTHALLHFSLLHIVFNLLWWWYLAGQVEKYIGSAKLIEISLVAALISGWTQSLFSGIWFGGLSGVVYALMGYVWWYGERQPQSAVGIPRGVIGFAVLWILVGWFDWFGLQVANAAHISGLIIGLLMVFWDLRLRRQR